MKEFKSKPIIGLESLDEYSLKKSSSQENIKKAHNNPKFKEWISKGGKKGGLMGGKIAKEQKLGFFNISEEDMKLRNSKAGYISAKKQWEENREKELEKCKKAGAVSREKNSKKTIMCDMEGNPIKEFMNRKDAAKFVNGNAAPLTAVLDNPNRSYRKYKWKNG